jgi:L-asparaginase/Glu-tRNA(Gln) amidotransferase subunit D
MDYLATGVSLLMRNLNKFVIFTGGITSIDLPNSDTNTNLVTALLFASTASSHRRLLHP